MRRLLATAGCAAAMMVSVSLPAANAQILSTTTTTTVSTGGAGGAGAGGAGFNGAGGSGINLPFVTTTIAPPPAAVVAPSTSSPITSSFFTTLVCGTLRQLRSNPALQPYISPLLAAFGCGGN